MIGTKCPGQDMRYWTAEDIHESKCPECGGLIEFWKTDIRVRCPQCKTKIANPRFNLGCAQWCAYAEQCLGPAAKGLKTKTVREVLLGEVSVLAENISGVRENIENMIGEAEKRCSENRIDMLPVITALVMNSLLKTGLVEDVASYAGVLKSDKGVPEKAVEDALEIISNLNSGISGERESIVRELLQDKFEKVGVR